MLRSLLHWLQLFSHERKSTDQSLQGLQASLCHVFQDNGRDPQLAVNANQHPLLQALPGLPAVQALAREHFRKPVQQRGQVPPQGTDTPPTPLASGQLDMSADAGGKGFGSLLPGSTASSPAPTLATLHASSSLASGQLDMSAFGGMGFGSASPIALAPASAPQTSQASSSLASGQLDMSAFGGMGFGSAPPIALAPASAPQTSQASSSLASGQLDMSAFGGMGFGSSNTMSVPDPPFPPPSPPPSSFETGQLDMSAFGGVPGFGGSSSSSSATPCAPAPQQPQLSSSLASGMLDLNAFGFGSSTSASQVAAVPPPPPVAEDEDCMPLGLRKLQKQAEAASAAADPPVQECSSSVHPSVEERHPNTLVFPMCPSLQVLGQGVSGVQLLSKDELAALEQLLGVHGKGKGLFALGSAATGSAQCTGNIRVVQFVFYEQGFDKVRESSRTLKLFKGFDVQFRVMGP